MIFTKQGQRALWVSTSPRDILENSSPGRMSCARFDVQPIGRWHGVSAAIKRPRVRIASVPLVLIVGVTVHKIWLRLLS